MADDLSDVYAELRRLQERVRILETANPLEASSVTNGQIRIIGGTIRVDGGGNLIVNGTMSVNGTSTVTGSFTVSGPWNLSGAGTISGNVTITGNVTATGTLTQNGPWNLNGAGTIAGDVNQTGNTTQQGNVTLTGGGKITAGLIEITPSVSGGSIQFGSGRRIDAGSGFLGVYDGGRFIVFNSSGVAINGGGGPTLTVGPGGIQGIPTIALSSAPTGSFVGCIVADSNGAARRVVA